MNKNQVKGRVEEVKGKVKEAAGVLADNPNLELEGNLEKNAGKLRGQVGDIQDEIKKAG